MNNIKMLIVDDEQPARRKIRTFLKNVAHSSEIFEAENGVEAVKMIQNEQPDLIFLDIQMPGMTGFEVIERVGAENMPAVIFVTAYDQYAIAAFEVQAVDYLLKPFDEERFLKSFERALAQIRQQNIEPEKLKNLLAIISEEKEFLQRIMVNKNGRFFFVNVEDIQFFEADEKYVKLHTPNETSLVRETMSNLESRLDGAKFARIHRSYIVNIDAIKELQPWSHGDYVIILKNGKELPLSRRYRERLFGNF